MIVISPNLVGDQFAELKKCTAIIGYQNYVGRPNVVVTASSSADNFPAASVKTSMTYERWLAEETDSDPWIEIDLGAAVDIDYIAVGAHTLGSARATASVYAGVSSDPMTEIGLLTTTTDNACFLIFDEQPIRYIKIVLSTAAEIGVIYAGRKLVMPRQMYGGHSPITLSRDTEVRPNVSVTGEFLGRAVYRRGFATTYAWQHLPATWYRAEFEPFVEHAIHSPFFIAWNPITFPDEAAYAWTDGDIIPTNMGIRDLMSVRFNVRAIA